MYYASIRAVTLLCGMALAICPDPVAAATVSWNVDGSGFWDVAGNWSTGSVPQAGDDVVIDRPSATITVTHRSGTSTIKSLTCSETFVLSNGTLTIADSSTVSGPFTLSGGSLRGSGVVTVNGPMSWTGGSMRDTGVTNANAGMQIANTGSIQLLENRTLNNAGIATWIGAGAMSNAPGATVNNLAGATFDVQTAGDLTGGTFNNAGTVIKVAGGGNGVTRVLAALNNTGTVTVQSGSLELDGGGQHAGSFAVETLATLQFGGGTHTFVPGASVSGAGTVQWAGGTTNFDAGTYNVSGTTEVSNGRHTFAAAATIVAVGTVQLSGGAVDFSSADALSTAAYTQSGGTLDGSDVLTVTGPVEWSGGAMSGTGVLNANAGMDIANPSSVQLLDNRTVNNAGIARWTGAGAFSNAAGATFNNLAGARFGIETAADLLGGTFNNAGTLTKISGGGDGRTRISAAFNNHGTVAVNSGTLELDGGGQHAGTFGVDASATLQFGGGTHTFTPGAAVGSSGSIEWAGGTTNFAAGTYNNTGTTMVTGGRHTFGAAATVQAVGVLRLTGGTVDFSSGEALTTSDYTQTAGTLDGSDVLTVNGLVAWSGGDMSGTGVLNANAGMDIANPGSLQLLENRTVNNAATATWTGAGIFSNAAGAKFNNLSGGSFSIQTAADFQGGTFNNAGTLTKTVGGGDGITQMSAALNNSGTVDVQGGTLRLTSVYTQTAGVTRLSGGTLESSRPINLTAGRLEGTGTVKGNVVSSAAVAPGLSPGLLLITGAYTQGAGGVLAVEIGGVAAGTEFDQLGVGGAATLDGTLAVNLVAGFIPAAGVTFKVMTFASHTGDFATTDGLTIGNGLGFRKVVTPLDITLLVVEEACADGVDNDGDGRTDCNDPKCGDFPACLAQPTATATRVPTATPTGGTTATATATAPPSPTATATPGPGVRCVGDCDASGDVNITELIRGVNIALGEAPLDRCPAFDANDSGEVTVNELIVGVNNALAGCPISGATPTPTGGVVVSPTPGPITDAVAGGVAVVANGMSVIPGVVAALVTGIKGGGAAAAVGVAGPVGGAAGACPLGGTATRTGTFPFPLAVSAELSNCRVPTADGSVVFNGTAGLAGTAVSADVTMRFEDASGAMVSQAQAVLTGSLVGFPSTGGSCTLQSLTMRLDTGSVIATNAGGQEVGVQFAGTTVSVDNIVYNPSCVPLQYRLTFSGPAALLAVSGEPIAVTFDNLVLGVDDRGVPTLLTLNGGMTATCFGGSVGVATPRALGVIRGEMCPADGQITVSPGVATIRYFSDQSVGVDDDGDGTADRSFPNCLDLRLFVCAA